MRWYQACSLTVDNFRNLAQGRIIEHVITNQRVPLDDGDYLDFQIAFKIFGLDAYIGFHDQQPYILKYFKPV